MTDETERSREYGMELGDLPDRLDAASFPLAKEDVLAEYGDHELRFPNGETTTLSAVLEPAGVDEFESDDELLDTLYHMVGSDAVGQEGQTGRGTSDFTPAEQHRPPGKSENDEEDQSF